jgi:hypothetical protein
MIMEKLGSRATLPFPQHPFKRPGDSPRPSRVLRDVVPPILAIPVLFVVGRDEIHATSVQNTRRVSVWCLVVSAVAVAGYVAGVIAVIAPGPYLAGFAVLVMAATSTICYLRGRGSRAEPCGPPGSR